MESTFVRNTHKGACKFVVPQLFVNNGRYNAGEGKDAGPLGDREEDFMGGFVGAYEEDTLSVKFILWFGLLTVAS